MDRDGARDRVLGYLRASARALADDWHPHDLGFTIGAPTLPRVWVLNRLVVEPAMGDGPDPEELARQGRQLMLDQGRRHARVTVLDDALGEAVAAAFRDLGWEVARHVLMVDSGDARPSPNGTGAEASKSPGLEAFLERVHVENFYGDDPEAVAQLRALGRRSVTRLNGKTFVAPLDAPGALSELRQLDGVGEIDFVQTLEERRREGLGQAALDAALAASREANELTFLEADADDWPREWYSRLGFEVVGSAWELDLSV